jgi:ribose transport system substrate-binding protein
MPNRSRLAPITAALAALLAAAALSACGSDDSSSATAASGSSGATTSSSGGVERAKALVAEASDTPRFVAPPAFDTSSASGKTVWWIGNVEDPILRQWVEAAREAWAANGAELRVYDTKGSIPEHVKGFDLAIAGKADAIVLGDGFPAVQFAAQVKRAKNAGIPFFSLVTGQPREQPSVDGLALDVSYDYRRVGELLAAWAIADSDGKAQGVFIETPAIPSSTFEREGFQRVIEADCPDCRFEYKEVEQTGGGASASDALANVARTSILSNPKTGYVITAFDSQALYAMSGVQQAGAGQRVKLAGFNTIVPQMQNLKKGTPFKMDVGGPNVWLGYALADNVMRQWAGEELVEDPQIGFKLFTEDNVQDLNVDREDDTEWYGVDYGSFYRRDVWGLER